MDSDFGMGDQKYELKAPAQKSADIDSKKTLLLSKWQGRFKWVPKEVKVYRQILVMSIFFAISKFDRA